MSMVDKVARAICDATGEFSWDQEDESIRSEFRKEAVHAIAAMGPQAVLLQWLPIETAPKDGSAILAYYPTKYGGERYSVRYWSSGDWGKITEGWVDVWRQISLSHEPSHWASLQPPREEDLHEP